MADVPGRRGAARRPLRMESQAIRDGILLLSGQLDATVGGPPVVFLHCAIFVSTQQVIGAGTLRLVNFSGKESISGPFEFGLGVHQECDRVGDLLGRQHVQFMRGHA